MIRNVLAFRCNLSLSLSLCVSRTRRVFGYSAKGAFYSWKLSSGNFCFRLLACPLMQGVQQGVVTSSILAFFFKITTFDNRDKR